MSSSFWVDNAANNKNRILIPGTSKWIANQLRFIQDEIILTAESNLFQIQNNIQDLNKFVNSVVNDDALVLQNTAHDPPPDLQANIASTHTENYTSNGITNDIFTNVHENDVDKSSNLPNDTSTNRPNDTRSLLQSRGTISPNKIANNSDLSHIKTEIPPVLPDTARDFSVSRSKSANFDDETSPFVANPSPPIIKNIPQLPSPVTFHSKKQSNSMSSPKASETLHLHQSTPVAQRLTDVPGLIAGNSINSLDIFRDIKPVTNNNDSKKSTKDDEAGNLDHDDSFQAIRTAIRKSIAEKRKSVNLRVLGTLDQVPVPPKDVSNSVSLGSSEGNKLTHASLITSSRKSTTENHSSDKPPNMKSVVRTSSIDRQDKSVIEQPASRTSEYKTPKRSSVFVSLPSREPITISSMPISRQSGIKLKQLKLTDRLETASKQEGAGPTSIDSFSPVRIPKKLDAVPSAMSIDSNSKIPTLNRSLYSAGDKEDSKSEKEEKIATELTGTSSATNKTNFANLKDIEGRRVSRASFSRASEMSIVTNANKSSMSTLKERGLQNGDGKKSSAPQNLSRSRSRSVSPPKAYKSRSTTLETTKTLSRSRSRSPQRLSTRSNVSTKEKSPTKSRSPTSSLLQQTSPSPFTDLGHGPSNLKSNFMLPTTASVAKSQPSKLDIPNTKNRFLTTTLNGSSPVFKPNKPSTYASKSLISPIKRGLIHGRDLTLKKLLDKDSIPQLQKLSKIDKVDLSSKPKQKISLTVKHDSKKAELVLNKHMVINPAVNPAQNHQYSAPTTESYKPDSRKVQSLFLEQQILRKRDEINSDRQTKRKNNGNAVPLPEAARGNLSRLGNKRTKTNRDLTQAALVGKSIPSKNTKVDPKTPIKLQYPGDNLPDILTDDEDESNKGQRILKDWAHTPEIQRTFMEQKHIDPSKVFGKVNLQIEEVFDSHSSKLRGRQSPDISPINPQRRREEREYALKMGYD